MGFNARAVRMTLAVPLASALVLTNQTAATAQPNTASDAIATLVGDVARADQELADLQSSIHTQQELVMKALHDLERARDTAQVARRAVDESQQEAQQVSESANRAQAKFDEFAASQYTSGPQPWPILATTPEQLISDGTTQQTMVLAFSEAQQNLQRARTEQTNAESAARQAQEGADGAARDAQERYDAAVQQLRSTESTFAAKQADIDSAATQARVTRQRLDEALRASPTTASAPADADGDLGVAIRDWDTSPSRQDAGRNWNQTVPILPNVNLQDPVAVINSVLQISATSAQLTADLGRRFLVTLGILPSPTPAAATAPTGQIPRVYGQQAAEFAIRRGMSQMGVPYSWGGGNAGGPTKGIDQGAGTVGFDCSGLMVYAFAGVGIKLPKYSGAQYEQGRRIPVSQMRRGDLLFWGAGGSQHVALYLGQGQMLEAPFTGSQVRVAPVRPSGMTTHAVRLIEY
ncbi:MULTISPECIES: NlpC/P60 family protein [Mycobacteriaceae]|uniref:NlpC/P60 family protein n=1 Tax=Mycobacteriaceae TaxID=1762 RepID=UPI0026ECE0A3|nr:NlpC/P60 family protein [Mycolicibacterium bacteremicum]